MYTPFLSPAPKHYYSLLSLSLSLCLLSLPPPNAPSMKVQVLPQLVSTIGGVLKEYGVQSIRISDELIEDESYPWVQGKYPCCYTKV